MPYDQKSSKSNQHANKNKSSKKSDPKLKTKPVVPSAVKNEKNRGVSLERQTSKKLQESLTERRTVSVDRHSKTKEVAKNYGNDDKSNSKNSSNEALNVIRKTRETNRQISKDQRSPTKQFQKRTAVRGQTKSISLNQAGQSTTKSKLSSTKLSLAKNKASSIKPTPVESRSNVKTLVKKNEAVNQRILKKSSETSSVRTFPVVSSKNKISNKRSGATIEPVDVNESEVLVRPRTSTIRKAPLVSEKNLDADFGIDKEIGFVSLQSQSNGQNLSAASDEEVDSYPEDFEEYESDFEESDTNSVDEDNSESDGDSSEPNDEASVKSNSQQTSGIILHPTIVKRQPVIPPKIVEKKARTEFLRMSTRSSTFLVEDANDTSPVHHKSEGSRSFINFASAVQKQEKQKLNNKVKKRGIDLLELIILDEISYDIVDIPPIKYEIFIKSFGKSNSQQISIQTENHDDEEIQTDEIDAVDKWTQHPPYDNFGVGGDKVFPVQKTDDSWESYFTTHAQKLGHFLQNVAPVVLSLLNEERPKLSMLFHTPVNQDLVFSQGYFRLQPLPFCQSSPAVFVCYSSDSSAHLLSVHSSISKVQSMNPISEEKGIICVWNIYDPEKPKCILTSNSQPTCACFSPNGSDIVIAGMVDGSLMLWDLTETPSPHLIFQYQKDVIPLRSPTYNTAVIFDEACHHSCVVSVQALQHYRQPGHLESEGATVTDTSKSFHVLSLEDMGILNIWVVVEVRKPDESGLHLGLGLAPGGKLRVVWSSTISIYSLNGLPAALKNGLRAFDFRCFPSNPNHILVTTDVELTVHFARNQENAVPRYYSRESGISIEIRCLSFSVHLDDLFLVGGSDGSVMLFSVHKARPLMVFTQAAQGKPVICISWSLIHPAMFFVLDNQSNIHFWDCSKSATSPVFSHSFPNNRVLWFSLFDFKYQKSKTLNDAPSQMALAKEDGEIEVHAMHHKLDNITEEEYERQCSFLKGL